MKIIFIAMLWFATGPGQREALDLAIQQRLIDCARHAGAVLEFKTSGRKVDGVNYRMLQMRCRQALPMEPPKPEPEKVTA